jgi:hypothetical protein
MPQRSRCRTPYADLFHRSHNALPVRSDRALQRQDDPATEHHVRGVRLKARTAVAVRATATLGALCEASSAARRATSFPLPRQPPGELIHVDVKKLGRIARPGHRVLSRQTAGGHHRRRYEQGWEFVHICVDDCTRLAYVEVLPDEKAATAIGFLRRAVAFTASTASTSND